MTRVVVSTETSVTFEGAASPVTLPPGYYEIDGRNGTLFLPSNQFVERYDSHLFTLAFAAGVLLCLVAMLAVRRHH